VVERLYLIFFDFVHYLKHTSLKIQLAVLVTVIASYLQVEAVNGVPQVGHEGHIQFVVCLP